MPSVLRISDAASLGFHTMALLTARPEKTHSTRAIAQELQVSEAHLSKVLQRLTKVGFVKSIRGARGGFALTPQGQGLSLLDVYEAIDGPLNPSTCLLGHPSCPGNGCILGDMLDEMNAGVRERFQTRRLTDLAEVFRKDQ